MPRVADYSAGYPGAENLKRTGYVGAVRYIGLPGYIKNATRAELDDFTRHGLSMGLVFEHYATDWRGGWNAGRVNMARSLEHAEAIGWPAGRRPIYMAVDQDVVTGGEFDAAMDYLAGAASVHPLGKAGTGPYGEYDVVMRSRAAGLLWQWQCRAWSGTPPKVDLLSRLYQYFGHPQSGPGGTAGPNLFVNGVECDTNEVFLPDWGGHLEEGIMATPQEIQAIAEAAAQRTVALLLDETRIGRSSDSDEPPVSGDFPLRWHFAAADGHLGSVKGKLDQVLGNQALLSSTLTANQAALLTAISDEPTNVELTGEQVQLLLSGLSEGSKAAVKQALREGTGQ